MRPLAVATVNRVLPANSRRGIDGEPDDVHPLARPGRKRASIERRKTPAPDADAGAERQYAEQQSRRQGRAAAEQRR